MYILLMFKVAGVCVDIVSKRQLSDITGVLLYVECELSVVSFIFISSVGALSEMYLFICHKAK